MRRFLVVVLAAIGPPGAAAASRTAFPKVETGCLYERYSASGDGGVWWANSTVPLSGTWAALLGGESVRRFGRKDSSGLAGLSYRGEKNGGYLQLRTAPDAAVVPRFAAEGVWDQSLAKGLYIEGSLRYSDYVPARVYAQSASLYWWPCAWAELLGKGTASTTEFRRAAATANPGFLLLANLFPRGENLRLTPSIGYYEEPFEAGSPGALNSFNAVIYHIGLGWRMGEGWEFKLDGEYESRSMHSFVRRGQAAVAYKFRR
ncbi:MAG TPA: hypothetical protein DCZ01_09185 [Elusimicrobia bacterium]|nr:MAG: hypothetical protein A2X37_09515 [Elusimicrobia bacterium GWA2_66_18]OGR73123.1 MAG: hypothetical protein A2X40_08085 [Elusimicrobia bacterium GWC2_65_9]HAZ08674.1 hypothetical protein [Elusimicrobiota bacterium]